MPLFKKPIEQEFFSLRLRAGRPMTELEFYARELTDWETSPERREMIDGDRYYTGDHDILKRQRTAIGPDGKLIVIENLPNNRIVDNQYAKHVDQKANYLLGQPISFSCENDDYAAEVKKVLGMRFMRTLKSAGVECLNAGISWLYPYYNKNGELAFRVFPGYEIMPFWADAAHTELDSALRLYPVEVYYGTEKKIVKKVDLFTLEGVTTYIFENGVLTPDTEKQAYVKVKDSKGKPVVAKTLYLRETIHSAQSSSATARKNGSEDSNYAVHAKDFYVTGHDNRNYAKRIGLNFYWLDINAYKIEDLKDANGNYIWSEITPSVRKDVPFPQDEDKRVRYPEKPAYIPYDAIATNFVYNLLIPGYAAGIASLGWAEARVLPNQCVLGDAAGVAAAYAATNNKQPLNFGNADIAKIQTTLTQSNALLNK